MRSKLKIAVVGLTVGAAACGAHDTAENTAAETQALSGTVLLVTASTTLNAADTAIKNRLQTLGFSVQTKAAPSSTSADANGKALVMVSSTITSGDVGTKFKSVSVPVFTWESAIYDDMAFVPSGAANLGTQTNVSNVTIAAPSHPMAAGLTGTPTVSSAGTVSWGKPAASAVRVATLPTDSSKSLIFGFDSGATLSDGSHAAARRVGFFFEDNTAASLNTNGWSLFQQAVTWAVGTTASSSVVKLYVSSVDDFVYVTVDGVRRKVYGIGQSDDGLDVSSWFGNGANSVRIQAINTGGPAAYSVLLTVNGTSVINEACFTEPCSALPAGSGIVLDKSFTINTVGPARQTVTVNGVSGGKLYINDQYSGLSVPTSLSLPQGSYSLGLGTGTDVPGSYSGQFYEQPLVVAGSSVTINVSQAAPLATPNHTRVAILPIRTTIHGAGGFNNTGVLTDAEIGVMQGQAIAARDGLLKPFSYNLTTWDIDLLPTVESTPLHRAADSATPPNTDQFLIDAGLTSLNQTYDQVIYFYSKFKADGTEVLNTPCCFWGGGQLIAFMNHMTRGGWASNYPNLYLLHESLHDYESYQQQLLHKYIGIDGTHGAGTHGYANGEGGEEDFLRFYRYFMRGQVPELDNMRSGVAWPSPEPATGDLYIGLFDVMRRDVNWQSPPPGARALTAGAAPTHNQIDCALPVPPKP